MLGGFDHTFGTIRVTGTNSQSIYERECAATEAKDRVVGGSHNLKRRLPEAAHVQPELCEPIVLIA